MRPPLESPFERLLVRLVKDGVVYAAVGGVAVCLNGYVRLTEVVDILVEASAANLQRLLSSLAGFGEGHARELTLGDFSDEEGAIRVVEVSEGCQVDIFTRMGGLRWEDLQQSVRYDERSGTRIPFLGPAGLIRLKSDSHRDKDRMDVEALRALQRDSRAFD